jgi:hypothetical protein
MNRLQENCEESQRFQHKAALAKMPLSRHSVQITAKKLPRLTHHSVTTRSIALKGDRTRIRLSKIKKLIKEN